MVKRIQTSPAPAPGLAVDTAFDTLVEFAAAGHREIAPVFLKDEDTGLLGIRGPHGLYRFGIHADGRPVVLFSTDPAALAPARHTDPKFRDRFAPGWYLDT